MNSQIKSGFYFGFLLFRRLHICGKGTWGMRYGGVRCGLLLHLVSKLHGAKITVSLETNKAWMGRMGK
jgi:hypothetical protein